MTLEDFDYGWRGACVGATSFVASSMGKRPRHLSTKPEDPDGHQCSARGTRGDRDQVHRLSCGKDSLAGIQPDRSGILARGT